MEMSRNFKPSKGLGQNFLTNKKVLETIIKTADLKPDDLVLEVGPGLGILTFELAKHCKVVAVEKDQRISLDIKNVEFIHGDALKIPLPFRDYKVVANIPYYITSPLIRRFMEADKKPKEMVLLVQKEVAQRICSKPPKMNILAISVQLYAKPEIITYVSKSSFKPSPKVDSAVIKISGIKNPNIDTDKFFKIIKAGFSHPRKKISNNLSLDLIKKTNIDPARRAETLSIDEWKSLLLNY